VAVAGVPPGRTANAIKKQATPTGQQSAGFSEEKRRFCRVGPGWPVARAPGGQTQDTQEED